MASGEIEMCIGSDFLWEASGLGCGSLRFVADVVRDGWLCWVKLQMG